MKVDEDLDLGKLWILAFIFFGRKATVGTTTLEKESWLMSSRTQFATDNEAWKDKRFIFSRFAAAGFDGETKARRERDFSAPLLPFLLSFALCSSFSRQSQSSLAMAQSALRCCDAWEEQPPSPSPLPAMRVATFSLIDCQIEIGTANARQKLHFTLNLIEQKRACQLRPRFS